MQGKTFAGVVVAVLLMTSAMLHAQATKDDAQIKAEDEQAEALFHQQNFLAALPLFEDLHVQRPQSLVYQERLAMVLLTKAGQQDGAEALATRKRAKDLLLQAKAGGDNSGLLQILLEKLQGDGAPAAAAAQPAGHEWLQKGETAFASGDLTAAAGFYAKAVEVNPQYYAAALFAGDAEYKLNHPAEAGKWFARAIEINPDIETAYRYWGDCLDKAGEHKRAEEEFIAGIVADPYSRTPRLGLKQWADRNHAMVVAPPIKLPKPATTTSPGHINITLSAGGKDDPETPILMAYSLQSALWQGDEFKKHFPDEKAYRHSLLEEAQSIRTMLAVARETKVAENQLSTSTKTLIELDKNGMLECWILLDNPDQGIAQDYVAYRKDHRELMERYIAQYDVHSM
jgi:tetratricopeptide (TPR) repeat protein